MVAPIFRDRVEEGTSTAGNGPVTVTGATVGSRTFNSAVPNGSTIEFCIDSGSIDWEVSRGVFTAPSTLSRDTVLSSSNGGALVNLGNGTKVVYLTASSAQLQKINGLRVMTQTANYTLADADMDNNTLVIMNSANATVLTVPTQANVPSLSNISVLVERSGNGSVTIAPQSNGVTVNAANAVLTLRAQYSRAALTQNAADAWVAFGDLG